MTEIVLDIRTEITDSGQTITTRIRHRIAAPASTVLDEEEAARVAVELHLLWTSLMADADFEDAHAAFGHVNEPGRVVSASMVVLVVFGAYLLGAATVVTGVRRLQAEIAAETSSPAAAETSYRPTASDEELDLWAAEAMAIANGEATTGIWGGAPVDPSNPSDPTSPPRQHPADCTCSRCRTSSEHTHRATMPANSEQAVWAELSADPGFTFSYAEVLDTQRADLRSDR